MKSRRKSRRRRSGPMSMVARRSRRRAPPARSAGRGRRAARARPRARRGRVGHPAGRPSSSQNRATSTLPPETITPDAAPRARRHARRAAPPRRRPRSARSRASCARTTNAIAVDDLVVGDELTLVHRRRLTANVSSPGVSACWPSAIVRGIGIATRSARRQRAAGVVARLGLDADHPDARRQRLRGGRAAGDQPAAADRRRAARRARPTSSSSSSAAVPCPAMTSGCSYGGTSVRPRSRPAPRRAPRGPRCSGRSVTISAP